MLHFHRSVAHVTFLYDRFFFLVYSFHSLSLLLSPCAVCVNVLICILSRFAVCFLPYYCQQEEEQQQQQQKQRTTKRAAIELCKKNKPRWGPPWASRCWSVRWFYNFKAAGLLLDWNSTRNALARVELHMPTGAVTGSERSD